MKEKKVKVRARFCSCRHEPKAKSKTPVYLKGDSSMTLNPEEATVGFREPIGELRYFTISGNRVLMVALNKKALGSLELTA